MWLQKKLNWISISLLIIPLLLIISLILFAFIPQNTSPASSSSISSWKKSLAPLFSSNSSIVSPQHYPHESSYARTEDVLAKARFSIKEAANDEPNSLSDQEHDEYIPQGPVYKNANAFLRFLSIYKFDHSSFFLSQSLYVVIYRPEFSIFQEL